jgi:hypothetical protein
MNPLRARREEAIEHPSDMVIAEVLRRQLLAEQHPPVTFLECRLQMVERTAPGKGVEHQAQGNHTGLDV